MKEITGERANISVLETTDLAVCSHFPVQNSNITQPCYFVWGSLDLRMSHWAMQLCRRLTSQTHHRAELPTSPILTSTQLSVIVAHAVPQKWRGQSCHLNFKTYSPLWRGGVDWCQMAETSCYRDSYKVMVEKSGYLLFCFCFTPVFWPKHNTDFALRSQETVHVHLNSHQSKYRNLWKKLAFQ